MVIDSAPAQIIAGGNLLLDTSHLINDKSQIIAGGEIVFDDNANTVEQIDGKGKHLVIQDGTSQYTKSRWRGGFKRYY